MKIRLLTTLMMASALTACDAYKQEEAKKAISNDPHIVRIDKIIPELGQEASVFYNFNDSTQTIVRSVGSDYSNNATYAFSRRGMNELKGTEKTELDSLIKVRQKLGY